MPMTASSSTLDLSGQTIDGRYELLSRLGSGTFGVVYKAIDKHFPENDSAHFCAVKLVSHLGRSPATVRALRREMTLHKCASHHPNVIPLHDTFEVPDYSVFVMDLSPDGDLEDFIVTNGPCTDETTIRTIFLGLLDAVEHMHEEGIYHRDIKPSNILVDKKTLHVYLTDFGVATRDPRYRARCGTTSYMPPGMSG